MKIYNYTGDPLTVGIEEITSTEIVVAKNTPVHLSGITINTDTDRIILYKDSTGIKTQQIDISASVVPWVLLFNAVGFFVLMVKIVQRLKMR